MDRPPCRLTQETNNFKCAKPLLLIFTQKPEASSRRLLSTTSAPVYYTTTPIVLPPLCFLLFPGVPTSVFRRYSLVWFVSADDEDIFQCGKCKKQFPISAYITHKQSRCTGPGLVSGNRIAGAQQPSAAAHIVPTAPLAVGSTHAASVSALRPSGVAATINPSPNSAFTATSAAALSKQVSVQSVDSTTMKPGGNRVQRKVLFCVVYLQRGVQLISVEHPHAHTTVVLYDRHSKERNDTLSAFSSQHSVCLLKQTAGQSVPETATVHVSYAVPSSPVHAQPTPLSSSPLPQGGPTTSSSSPLTQSVILAADDLMTFTLDSTGQTAANNLQASLPVLCFVSHHQSGCRENCARNNHIAVFRGCQERTRQKTTYPLTEWKSLPVSRDGKFCCDVISRYVDAVGFQSDFISDVRLQ